MKNKNLSVLHTSEPGIQKLVEVPLPGTFMSDATPSSNSWCSFRYGLPNKLSYEPIDVNAGPQLGSAGSYSILYNAVQSNDMNITNITYCTHITPEFVYYLAEIIKRWTGYVSVAAFVPHQDADLMIRMLTRICYCVPNATRLSIHLVFPKNKPPKISPHSEPLDLLDCTPEDASNVLTYRHRERLPYPVNVCRNVARQAAKTKYVLVSDVELLPSENLAYRFGVLLSRRPRLGTLYRHIFVLPVFEIDSAMEIPRNKKELIRLYDAEMAVYFHRFVCSHCQKFPGLIKWLEGGRREISSLSIDDKSSTRPLRLFGITRREHPFHRWEPVYIGGKNEPLYSESLTWEGQQDKMLQVFIKI